MPLWSRMLLPYGISDSPIQTGSIDLVESTALFTQNQVIKQTVNGA